MLERMAEDMIAESMAKGDFDNLPGKDVHTVNTITVPFLEPSVKLKLFTWTPEKSHQIYLS